MPKLRKPSPAINRLSKAQKAEQKDFAERVNGMKPELVVLCRKWRIDIVGGIDRLPDRDQAVVIYADAKKRYEQEAKSLEEKPQGLIV